MSFPKPYPSKSILGSPFVITAVAILLRTATVLIFHFYRFSSKPDVFDFGWEMGSVARALATGHGFSSPCRIPSGPTALVPPVYPYLIAVIFKAHGVYSDNSAAILLLFNAFCSGLVCLVLVALGRRTVGLKAAILGAWVWAFWPMSVWESHRIWESSLSVLLFTLTFLSLLALQKEKQTGFGALCGLLWGLTALTNPAILAFVIPALIYLVFREKTSRNSIPAAHGIALLMMCITISPWIIRDYVVFHRFMAIRDGLPLELYLGNHQQGPGENVLSGQVCNSLKENRKLAELGELTYLQEKAEAAKAFIVAHPGEFGTRTVKRAFYFWASTPEGWLDVGGTKRALFAELMNLRRPLFALSSILAFIGLVIGWRRQLPGIVLFTILLVLPPLPYYLTHGENRYRHPIEPEIMLLAAYTLVTAIESGGPGRSRTADQRFRKPLLYPTELRGHSGSSRGNWF
jgi:hypothetical protein